MKPNHSNDRFSDPDAALDALFRLRELAPTDFAKRTVAAARRKQRQARVIRFTAWSSGLAACFALLLGFAVWRPAADQPGLASAPEIEPTAMVTELADAPETAAPDRRPQLTADELTAALYAAFSQDDIVFYAQARTLEALLSEAATLSEEESELTLDFLILLAQN